MCIWDLHRLFLSVEVYKGWWIHVLYHSHTVSNVLEVSMRMLTVFSCTIIQEIFHLASSTNTDGCFQARAKVILAPSSIKWMSFRRWFEHSGGLLFSKAISGVLGIARTVTLCSKQKILLEKPLMHGHSHQVWDRVPTWPQLLKPLVLSTDIYIQGIMFLYDRHYFMVFKSPMYMCSLISALQKKIY